MKKILSLFLVAAMLFAVGCAPATTPDAGGEATPTPAPEQPVAGKFTAGTYEGSGMGNNGPIKVEVVLTDSAIAEVNIVEHTETAGLSDGAMNGIPAVIVAGQTLAVDAVAGATNSSKGILEAVTAALTAAGVDVSTLQTKGDAQVPAQDALADATFDVVVLGAGGAGLAAAIEAKNNGAEKVALVEKMSYAGGNTLLSYAELACAGNWLQTEKGIEDSNELFAKEMWEGGGKLARKEMVDTVVNGGLAAAEWLRDYIGVVYQDYLVHEGGHSVARAVEPVDLGPGMILPMVAKAEELGVEIFYNTKAEELVMDGGRVTGVKVSKGDVVATFSANSGVVLATGGFGANVEMRERYNTRWETLDASVLTTNSPAIVGEGIVMAEKIGAQLEGMEHIQLYPFNNPMTGVFYGIEAPSWSGEGIVYVNMEGKRFVNELGMRDERAEGILAQNGPVFAIYNQEVADRMQLESKFADEYAKCLAGGVFFKADTLAEIADHFGINAANLEMTMDDYNRYMTNGVDEEFGRTTSMVPMNGGPWFILQGVVSVHHTMGGVMIDTEAHVIDTAGNVIPGLYAAGEVTGSVHGNNRVGTCAITDITVFGRIAGTNAAQGK